VEFSAIHIVSPKLPTAAGTVQPADDGLNIETKGVDRWSFTAKDTKDFRTTLALTGIKSVMGYDPVTLYFDVPYYWNNKELVLPFANDSQDVGGAQEFANTIFALPNDHADLALLNQRARRIFLARKDNVAVPAQPCDVKVVYYLLQSSFELARRDAMQMDEATREAADWARNQMARPKSVTNKLFNSSTASLKDMQTLILQVDSRDAMVMGLLVERIEADLKPNSGADRSAICDRANTLSAYFANLGPEERAALDGTFGNSVRVAAISTLCTTVRVQQAAANAVAPGAIGGDHSGGTNGSRPMPSDVDVHAVLKASKTLTDAAAAQGKFPKARANAVERAKDLRTLVH
jgi:hypothetical protein